MILAYVVRHGSTDMSPTPEWQSQIGLNDLGRAQARDAGEWIKRTLKPLPTWGVSSDLKRAMETLSICSRVLNLEVVNPIDDLRALDKDEEQDKFEARNKKAFTSIFAVAKVKKAIPLIACHRSNTAWLAKTYMGVREHIDYREASAVREGGVIRICSKEGSMPLYRTLDENARDNFLPSDGTGMAGVVTGENNLEPRRCDHCKWYDMDNPRNMHCDHPEVTADDEVGIYYGYIRNADGKWMMKPPDCCNGFQHKFQMKYGGGA